MSYKINPHEFNAQHWEFIRNLTKEEYEEQGLSSRNPRGLYRCNHCSALLNRVRRSFKTSLLICPNECNGVRHGNSSKITLKGINDIATTHPHLIKYFANEADAYRYSAGSSSQCVKLQCPDCSTAKHMRLNNLVRSGFNCLVCSDGCSYPEKFMSGLLRQLSVEFTKEYTLDNGETRYDFYLVKHNCIVEVHGGQHYIGHRHPSWNSFEEEQVNDKYKMDLALSKGIEHYIVIDARESNPQWMKQSVLKSNLPQLLCFGEGSVNWDDVAIYSERSLVKEVCDYFNEHGGNAYVIARIFNISRVTAYRYLLRGTELGWCNYTTMIKERSCSAKKQSQRIENKVKELRCIHLETNEEFTFSNTIEASRWLLEQGLTKSSGAQANISLCCNNKIKSAYGYKWEYVTIIK